MASSSPPPSPPDDRSSSRADIAKLRQISPADIGNFAPVARIMKTALPENAKIAKEAKECMQECVSEFISFITSEGMTCVSIAVSLHSDIADSFGEVPAGEAQDREWRRYSLRHDFAWL